MLVLRQSEKTFLKNCQSIFLSPFQSSIFCKNELQSSKFQYDLRLRNCTNNSKCITYESFIEINQNFEYIIIYSFYKLSRIFTKFKRDSNLGIILLHTHCIKRSFYRCIKSFNILSFPFSKMFLIVKKFIYDSKVSTITLHITYNQRIKHNVTRD